MDRFDESAAHGVRGLAVARATGQGFLVPMLTQASATAISIQGRLNDAAKLLNGAVEASRLAGNDQTLGLGSHQPGVRRRPPGRGGRGDRGCGREHRPDPRSRQRLRLDARRRDARNRAVGERRTRERDRALRRRRRRGGDAAAAGWLASEVSRAPDALLADARQAAEAGRTVDYAAAVAAETGLGMAAAWAQRAAAATALDAGDAAAAAELALSSAAACDLAGAAVEAAVSRTLAGSALGSAGEGERAVAELQRAIEALDEAGATRYRLGAERELRKLGHAVIGVADPAPPTRPASRRSRRASSSSHAWWSTARRTPRSRPRCSSVRKRSNRTCGTSSASSASARASSSRAPWSARTPQASHPAVSTGVRRNLSAPARRRRSTSACRSRSGSSRASASAGHGTPTCRSSVPPAGERP